MNARDKRIERAQLRVLFNVPFFAPGVARMPVVWDESIPTACTDGKRIRFNPGWSDKCKDQELVTVLCEEVGHCLLGHLWRAPVGADHRTWNMACDQAVRLMMREFGEQVKAKGLADPFPFPEPEKSSPSDCYRGMSEEQIYGLLADKNSGEKPGGKPGKDKDTAPAPGQPDSSGAPLFAEFEAPKAQDQAAAEAEKHAANDWKNTMIQSIQAGKKRGDVPGGVLRIVGEMLQPQVSWPELVRRWLREQCSDDWSWSKPNPYFDESGFILPSLDSERMGAIVFATDTSESINQEMLAKFQSEKQSALDELKPVKLVDICCDTRITKEAEYRPGDTIDKDAPGGGGTRFEPVFERLEEMQPPPKCVVYLTDLQGTFPDVEPSYPVLWVTWDEDGTAPFGEVVKAS